MLKMPETVPNQAAPLNLSYGRYYAAALALFLILFGGSLPTPLYPVWQQRFELGTGVITGIYGVYPMGVIAGLLFGGVLSDQIGRRPIVLAGAFVCLIADLFFMGQWSVGALFVARILNGLAIGLLSGPAVAAIVELNPRADRKQGAWLSSITTILAIVFGPLVTTILIRFPPIASLSAMMPFVTHAVAVVLSVVLVTTRVTETLPAGQRVSWGAASLRPQGLEMPTAIRAEFWAAASVSFLTWGCAGLWLALGPSLVNTVLGPGERLLGGLAVVAVLSTASAVQIAGRQISSRRAMLAGLLLLPAGTALVVLTLVFHAPAALLAGSITAGAAHGFGWMGASESIAKIAPASHRAAVMSIFYIMSYIGAALPVLVIGVVADALGLTSSVTLFSATVTAFAFTMATRIAPLERS